MSVSTFSLSVNRCANAPSRMALFKTRQGEIDVVFADTVITQSRIANNDQNYLCTFEQYSDHHSVLITMREAFNAE